MEETVHDFVNETRKKITTALKYEVEGSFNLKTIRDNLMCTFFHTNLYEFSVNWEVMTDEGI